MLLSLLENPVLVSKDHYLLKFKYKNNKIKPGQFLNIKPDKSNDPLIRRPFSIYNFDEDILQIIVQVVGKGTKIICNYLKDEKVDIIAPLGNTFSIQKEKNILLIGGGVGNAPLYFLAKKLKENNCHLTYLYGARSKEYIYLKEEYNKITDRFILCTDDGTSGLKGFTTDHLSDIIKNNQYDYIYTCGPTLMMQKISEKTSRYNIPLELSLENYFGCGIGLCSGCTVDTKNGQKKACIDGPVFSGNEIIWD